MIRAAICLLAVCGTALAGPDLRAYYQDPKREPDWRGDLAARPEQVVALLDAALGDELSGAAPWRATPYWGSSGENPARELRGRIAAGLAKAPARSRAMVARWFLAHETVDRFVETAFGAALDSDELLAEALQHENAVVVVKALKAGRKLPAEAFLTHHRASIRNAAAARLGLLRPFDPVAAMQSEPLRKLMSQLDPLILESAPAHAPLVGFERSQERFDAWLLDENPQQWTLLTLHGRRETVDKKGATVTPQRVEDVCRRLAALRKKNDPDFKLSERGGLTGQFQGHGASLQEALFGHWLLRTGRPELAAQILLPALDTLYRDRHLVDLVRHGLGEIYGQQMLVAFAGDRDLARTERLARTLSEHFPGTRFSSYAKELAAELPRRKDDFGTFRLPAAGEWQALKAKLSRAQQIDFLVERLRLLNCFQMGQPGGVSYDEKQTREPQGLAAEASWGLGRGTTEVVNPWSELDKGMALTVADIALLAPHLRDDWLMPTVSFWRDFHPDRELHHTRRAVTSLIDGLARTRLVDEARLDGAQREQEIERIRRWAAERGKRSETDLLLDAVDQGKDWYSVEAQARALVERKEKRALPLFRKYLSLPGTNEYNLVAILSSCRSLDAPAARDLGEKYVGASSLLVRVEAARILLAAGDRPVARTVLGAALEGGDRSTLYDAQFSESVEALLDEGSPESRATASRVFANPNLAGIDPYARAAIMRRFLHDGASEPWRFYQRLLATRGHRLGGTTWGAPVAEVFADELVDQLEEPSLKPLAKIPSGPARVAAARKWLDAEVVR